MSVKVPGKPKWKEKMNVTAEEYFNIPWYIPNVNVVMMARTMEKELGKEKAHSILRKVGRELAEEYVKKVYSGKKIESLRDFIEVSAGDNPLYDRALIMEKTEASDYKYEFRVHSCLWAKTWKELGDPDIGYLWNCCFDLVEVELVNPKLRLTRKGTLMRGAPYCDFCYTWER